MSAVRFFFFFATTTTISGRSIHTQIAAKGSKERSIHTQIAAKGSKEYNQRKQKVQTDRRNQVIKLALEKTKKKFVKILGEYPFPACIRNDMPQVPLHSKCLASQRNESSLVNYSTTSVEIQTKSELNCESNVGTSWDVVRCDSYAKLSTKEKKILMSKDDEDLLLSEDETIEYINKMTEIQKGQEKPLWLQKSLLSNADRFGGTKKKNRKKKIKEEKQKLRQKLRALKENKDQIQEIVDSFDVVKRPALHPTKPNTVKMVRSWPLVPDLSLLANNYAYTTFDTNPAKNHAKKAERRYQEKVMPRNVVKMVREVDDEGALIASLMIPEKNKRKRKRDDDSSDDQLDKYVFLRNVMLKIEETDGFGMVVMDWDSKNTEKPCRFFVANAKFGIARCQKEDNVSKTWQLNRVEITEDEKNISENRLKQYRSSYEEGEEDILRGEVDLVGEDDNEEEEKKEEVEENDDDDFDDEFK